MPSVIWPGRPDPLGANADEDGVNFALFSETATRVFLCLFDAPHRPPRETIELPERTGRIFHGYVPGLRPGQLYGFRVDGPYEPHAGLRHNPHKLMLDPYARAVAWSGNAAELFAYRVGDPAGDLAMDREDNAADAPKGVVATDAFDWGDDRRPATPWTETLIYELHVKGMSRLHPHVSPTLRGTYAGLASPPIVEHLKSLGVTAVELLPVHEIYDEPEVRRRGLVNYWGYSTLGFFAPAARYAADPRPGGQIAEFKAMVKTLHAAGIEVILDVVFNHTCEGGHLGPSLSLRGIDNRAYYLLDPAAPRYYSDFTGCGNTLNLRHAQTLRLVLDSLRYWAEHMHVDGFRFDLAPALSRRGADVDRHSPFLAAIGQDPLLSRLKLIAEPWDVGPHGYQLGGSPHPWVEWNGRYRDAVRRYWRGDLGLAGELGYRLTGSSDLFSATDRGPTASVNYVACHDGFTLSDLTAYSVKHNHANGEDNRDGNNHEHSSNWGVEGPSEDPRLAGIRARTVRNFLTTLAVSQGVPMLAAGDEFGRTQRGNNNAYCQDNPTSWLSWETGPEGQQLLAFARRALALRSRFAVLRRSRFFAGASGPRSKLRDISWLRPDGRAMGHSDWVSPSTRALALLLGGDATGIHDARGEPVVDATLLVLLNADEVPTRFALPCREMGRWQLLVDTAAPAAEEEILPASADSRELRPASMEVLLLRTDAASEPHSAS
ncbi:glycogen debranching protein GlgX [Nannocystis radixulma]|uniref:Glycogen debranching protein GlgX n=1 Tax=Nannocystis radixulma TaxID=2995305 RepID=A0ABT5B736_9BACT|nr:glycogen debranching protein GlgX [Nannocystis radixulma]MDC0669543.1 glycogen debranching protein GlgX [Nannocystis radixulma]